LLRTGQSGVRTQVGIRDFLFSISVQARCGAHPVAYIMGTETLCRGVKQPGRGIDHPPTCSAEAEERLELHIYSPSVSVSVMECYGETFTFTLEA
jgi:hypothetical protein